MVCLRFLFRLTQLVKVKVAFAISDPQRYSGLLQYYKSFTKVGGGNVKPPHQSYGSCSSKLPEVIPSKNKDNELI